jgi:RNA polymerase sigma-70 factor (family 1)
MLDYQSCSDSDLISLMKKDDHCAFTAIYKRHASTVYRNAYKLLNDRNEVMDIVHDIFASLWNNRAEIVLKTNLAGYLYVSARNKVFKLISHQQIASKYLQFIKPLENEHSIDTDHLIRKRQLQGIIENEISELPLKMQQILNLSRKSNLTHKEIGATLNISEHTVKKQVNNALKILRVRLSTYLYWFFILLTEF